MQIGVAYNFEGRCLDTMPSSLNVREGALNSLLGYQRSLVLLLLLLLLFFSVAEYKFRHSRL